MNAIEGVIATLASKTSRPQGYPFSKIKVYSVCPQIAAFMPDYEHIPASDVPAMRKLDFKKAGKAFGNKVQEMKNDLSKVPEEFIITASRFDQVDEPNKKITGCRKYLIEVESEDREDWWKAICFKKLIKKFVTDELELPILHPIFGDKYPDYNIPPIPRVWCKVFNCSEAIYQALEEYGYTEFSDTPIRLSLVTREELYNNKLDKDKYNMYNLDGMEIGIQI